MTRPSKGAAAFLIFFGLMFFVPALLALFTFAWGKPDLPFSGRMVGVATALAFSAMGAGFVFAAIFGYRKLKGQAAIEEANPQSPWLWKRDWSASRAQSQNKNKPVALWIACIFCNLLLMPWVVSLLPDLISKRNPLALLFLGFAALGVILFVYALRASLRHRRFGDTYFEFDSLPFSPGGRLTGRIHFKFDLRVDHGVDLRLSCIRKTITGTGNDRSSMETLLWQSERNVSSGALGTDSSGRTIPVDFAIPADSYVTYHDNPSDQVLWVLHAQADVPGINFSDDFEVPVFRSSATANAASPDSSSLAFGDVSAVGSDSGTIPAPAHPRVVVSSQAGGTEFYFRPFRSPARATFLLFFTAIWSGAVYLLFHSSAPWFFPVVFGAMDLLVIFALFHIALSSTRILVGNGEITCTTRVLGIGSARRFAVSDVEALVPVTSGQTGIGPQNATYAIRLLTKNGKRFTVADEVTSRQEARWIVSQIESLAGLKIDTRVQIDAPFGASALPPQPGQQVFTSARPGWQQARPASAKATAISFAIFGLCVAAMFAWQGRRFSTLKSMANSRARNSRAAAASKVPPKRVFAQPLTDADAARISALPAQDQAEELLERAIEHDQRALDLFSKNVEGWIGHIRLTDRMQQLEYRSQYSSDLRVRYANADINLTLDGWHKDEEAAEMLIARASTDQQYRAAAVYFLGMLAGRGVAYDKIHPVLLNYAKHDPDPVVRQWAVEGMRYLGKDEALDELWESFTQDPSMSVRNRAGCNLSDCGNFTRYQRMRMVPKFLELAADRTTNAQMRNWCFMALREITDANLPNDAPAWRDWYGKHGAAKLAEFEMMDWWHVRGDE